MTLTKKWVPQTIGDLLAERTDQVSTLTARCEALQRKYDEVMDTDNGTLHARALKAEARCEALERYRLAAIALHDGMVGKNNAGMIRSDLLQEGSRLFDEAAAMAGEAHPEDAADTLSYQTRCEALEQERDKWKADAEQERAIHWDVADERLKTRCQHLEQAINLSVADLILALSLMREPGTDPEAWIENVRHRLAALLHTEYTQALDDALKGRP